MNEDSNISTLSTKIQIESVEVLKDCDSDTENGVEKSILQNETKKRDDYGSLVMEIFEDNDDNGYCNTKDDPLRIHNIRDEKESNLSHEEFDDLIEEYDEFTVEYVCSVRNCQEVFSTSKLLDKHLKNHNRMRNFKCNMCNNCFSRSYSLKIHERTHTGERPYKCTHDDCIKSFKTSGDLLRHKKIHTAELPFKCTYNNCKSVFTKKISLNNHMRKHTSNTTIRNEENYL